MLQIGSGKLFQREAEHENHLRGVIYTNLKLRREREIETDAGTILPTSNLGNSLALVYEFSELIESHENGPGVLISHGVDPYISDFSTILSFALNCIATPDYELTDRLLSSRRSPSTPETPNRLVRRVFDREVRANHDDEVNFISFVNQLIGLKRKTFLAVMRAIKTYVTGMHRISDDLELAYTLLVASVESLAQDFDEHEATWEDFDPKKRNKIDRALVSANEKTIENVRTAILEIEHTALARRFRVFTLNNLGPSFFREEVNGLLNPVTREELPGALKIAYRARSKYIHNLKQLPKLLTMGSSFSETCRVDRETWLTLQGLSRIVRHVILEFIRRQPTIKKEVHDYHLERSGIVQAPLAPQYWVGNVKGMDRNSAPRKLEGFLSQLGSYLLKEPGALVTDLTAVLEEVENLIPTLKKKERRPFLALYFIFNGLLSEENRMPGLRKINEKYRGEISEPSPEAAFMNLLFNITPQWSFCEHQEVINRYFKTRDNKQGFRAPRVLEAGILLDLAERYRDDGSVEEAKLYISRAVENYPEHEGLRLFENEFLENNDQIRWENILLADSNRDNANEA